ncbi:MAG: glycine cleavage system regulatory protein [Akkermansiaceae bacterium]|jgi:glycine cleavage system regulatory protein
MNTSLVLTILGPDRTGLVGAVADAVAQHGGSWQESRMARLAGQFAGILRVACPAENREALEGALKALGERGLTVMIAHDRSSEESPGSTLTLDITGHDEPGILKRIAQTFASLGVNVEELHTFLESAPMAGHLLFCTRGKVRLPDTLSAAELIEALEKVGADLTVDVQS